jgi:Flp pilus assembly protein CpaB
VELTAKKYGGRDWRKLLTTRRGTALVAAACAIVAAGILVFAMQRYRHNVNAEGSPQTVLVASAPIQKGTSGDVIASGQLFKATSVPGKQVSTGAIADTAALHGRVAATDIYPGEQLTAADFTASGGIVGELGPNERAMTVTVTNARGMVGQVEAGDRVDVYADIESSGRGQSFVVLLMSNVPVLKAPTGPSRTGLGANNGENQQSNVTLKVNDAQAGELAFATDNGKVWLALRPANASSPANASGIVSASTLVKGRAAATPGGGK